MNKPIIGATDGDKLLEWLVVEIDLSSGNSETEKADRWAFRHVKREIESGRLTIPSDQGEATRLQEALNSIVNGNWSCSKDRNGLEIWSTNRINPYRIALEALSSSHREDTPDTAAQPDIAAIVEHCSDLNHFDTEEHNDPEFFGNLSLDEQEELLAWVTGLMQDSARTAINMYLDEQVITIPGITEER